MAACKHASRFSDCWEIFKKWIIGHDVLNKSLDSNNSNQHSLFSPDEATIVIILDSMIKSFESNSNMFGIDKNIKELKNIYMEHLNIVKEVWICADKRNNPITTGIMNNMIRLIGRIGTNYHDILDIVSKNHNEYDVSAVQNPDMITFHSIMQGLVYLNAPISILQRYFSLSCHHKILDIHLINRILLGLIKQIRHEPNPNTRELLEKTKRILNLCCHPQDFTGLKASIIYIKLFENIDIPKFESRIGRDILNWFIPNQDISKWGIKPNEMTHSMVLQAIYIGNVKALYKTYSERFMNNTTK